MTDLRSILTNHHARQKRASGDSKRPKNTASFSLIPDIFFNEVLVQFKMSRIEVLVLMHIYRKIWCRPNLYRQYGIGEIMSYEDMAVALEVQLQELFQALQKLESLGLISSIRSGQYFMRKYFTKELDQKFDQSYDDF